MKKTLLVLAVGVLLAAPAALAQSESSQTTIPTQAAGNTGAIKELAVYYHSDGPAPVRMPAPKDSEDGPMGFSGSDVSTMGRGAAIPNTAGGSFMGQREQADQNIRQLIRKLG